MEDEVIDGDSAFVVLLRGGLNDDHKWFILREGPRGHLGLLPQVESLQLSPVQVKYGCCRSIFSPAITRNCEAMSQLILCVSRCVLQSS